MNCRGETHSSAKLTEAQVREILTAYADGEQLASLHRRFPQCSKPNLHHIVNGRRWAFLHGVAL